MAKLKQLGKFIQKFGLTKFIPNTGSDPNINKPLKRGKNLKKILLETICEPELS